VSRPLFHRKKRHGRFWPRHALVRDTGLSGLELKSPCPFEGTALPEHRTTDLSAGTCKPAHTSAAPVKVTLTNIWRAGRGDTWPAFYGYQITRGISSLEGAPVTADQSPPSAPVGCCATSRPR